MELTYTTKDTVVALATPPGEGGVAIVRISGEHAQEVARAMTSIKTFTSHKAQLAKVLHADGTVIDRALILPLLGTTSFTGEDTIEIQCHGGRLIPQRIIDRAIQCGARPALPGEFSYKAYANGKLSLTQAEAIQSLIGAKNETALSAATQQLEGRLHKRVSNFQKQLFDIAAIIEAWVDFPEEGLEFASQEELLVQLTKIAHKIQHLIDTYHDGKRIHTSYTLCLIGEPNVGKSSLLNALLGKDRAIVTPIAGTTRDVLEEELHIGRHSFRIHDTAGLRESTDEIEQEGVRRSKKIRDEADIILYVLDRTRNVQPDLSLPKEKTIAVWNKADLDGSETLLPYEHVSISAREETGLDALQESIVSKISLEHNKEELLLTNARHYHALMRAHTDIIAVIEGLATDVSAEFVASDIRSCLKHLASIIGTDVTEDILSSIFSKFCVGK